MDSLADCIITYAREKHLSAHTLARWQAWAEEDQAAFLTIVQDLQLGENHLRDFLDWLEEIVARDGGTIHEVLAHGDLRRSLVAKLARNDKLKVVKDALRKLRYPRLSRLEDELRAAVKALDLGSRVRISFPPALEGDEITIEIKASTVKEVDESLTRLRQRLEEGGIQRMFGLWEEV